MQLTININDRKIVNSLIHFLNALGINVLTGKEKIVSTVNKKSGAFMADALKKIAGSGKIAGISDASKWQKETRKDREF